MTETGSLGARIRAGRLAKGLQLQPAARRIGVSKATLSRWEADKLVPRAGSLARVAQALEVPLAELMALVGQPTPANGVERTTVVEPEGPPEIERALRYMRGELGRALENCQPEHRQEIIEHLQAQVTLLADLAARQSTRIRSGRRRAARP